MKRKSHKLLSLLLSVLMLLNMGVTSVFAEDTASSEKARVAEKTPLTITLPKLQDRQQMDPVPEVPSFEDFTYEGLKKGDDGPTLLRNANAKISGFPTNSYNVVKGSYNISFNVNKLPDYAVTVNKGEYFVGDKVFDEHPFTVSPKAAYTDKNGVPWYNAPITLTATHDVFSYIGVKKWDKEVILTEQIDNVSTGQRILMGIDDQNTCNVQYKNFKYRMDTAPPEIEPSDLSGVDITDTSITAQLLGNDNNIGQSGSGIKTVYFLLLPEEDPAPTVLQVVDAKNEGVKDSRGFFNCKVDGLRASTHYIIYAVVDDNVGNRTGVIASDNTSNTRPSTLAGEVVIDNMSPIVGDTITATLNPTTADPGEISYQWYWLTPSDEEKILITCNQPSYKVGSSAVGNRLFCKARARNSTGSLDSEKTTAVPKMQQKPLGFNSYSKEISYGLTNRPVTASKGSGSGAITYTSSDPTVATIDNNGKVTPVNVGAFTVIATKAGDELYEETSITSETITITPGRLYIDGLTAVNREYDGTNKIMLTGGTLRGVINNDEVFLAPPALGTVEGTYAGKRFVTVTEIPLQGAKANCYVVNKPSGIEATILSKPITIEGVVVEDKPYDGTAKTTYKSSGTIKGLIEGDTINFKAGTCTFSDPNAGEDKTITATDFALSDIHNKNYVLSAQPVVPAASISQVDLAVTIEKVIIKKGQAIPSPLNVSVTGFVAGESDALTGFVKPTASINGVLDTTDEKIKTFPVSYTGGNATGNYTFSYQNNAPIEIQTVPITGQDYSADTDLSKWTNTNVVITPTNGYTQISTDKQSWNASLTLSEEGQNTVTFYLKKADGTLTESKAVSVKIDRTAPTGEIAIGENKWNAFLNTITFGLFFKETQTAKITAADTGSGVDKIYFYLSETELTKDEVKALAKSSWTESNDKNLAPNWKGIVYAKFTDAVGNSSYLSSDGLVFYAESTVTPTNAEFCKAVAKQADVTITMALNDNTLKDIQNGTTVLQKDRDYTVDGTTVTLKKAYLGTLPAGIATLKFHFNPMGAVGNTVSSADVKITITDPISYGVWVGGVVITEDNAANVLEDGTVSYDLATESLTLNDATITEEERQHFAIYAPTGCNLKVVLEGENSIMVEGGGIYAEEDLTLSGTGRLVVDVEKYVPISAGGDLTIDGVEIGAFSNNDGAITASGNVIIQKGATVTAKGTLYGLASVGDLLLSGSNVDASATGEWRNAISSEQLLTIENASEILAESHGPALFSRESLVLSDSIVHVSSTNDLGIYTLSALTITSGELYAKGGIGKAAIGARVVQENNEEPTAHIILGTEMKDESFAKVAVSSWYTSSGEQKSWTSFIAKEETAPLATNLSNAVNEVAIKSHTHAYGDWIADADNHWKECACGEISGKTAHTPEADDSDCTTAITCSVCDKITTATKNHTLSDWQSDEKSHWKKCTNAGCTVKDNDSSHTPGDAATIEHAQVCTVCDYILAEKLPSKNAIVDDSTGISVKYEDGSAFDSTVTLSVTPKPQSEMDKFKNSIDKAAPGLVLGGLYDIKLLKDGVAIQPNGKIRVSIPLTENMKAMTDLKVVYIDDNGKITIIPSEVKDGEISFVTDHFSYYGVIGKVKATDVGNNSGNGTNSPQTGDDSNLPLMVAVLLLAGGTLITLLIKRKKPKND